MEYTTTVSYGCLFQRGLYFMQILIWGIVSCHMLAKLQVTRVSPDDPGTLFVPVL